MQKIHIETTINFNGSCAIQAAYVLPDILENPFCLLFTKFSIAGPLHAY